MIKRIAAASAAVVCAVATTGIAKKSIKQAKAERVDGTGQTVLITGGSNGIGKAVSEIFAKHNFDIVLAARNEEKLHTAADELTKKYSVNVQTISVDLSSNDGARKLFDELLARNITVNQFVNNAGAGKASDLVDTDAQTLTQLIALNVTSVTLLNKYIVAEMLKNNGGKILNVASLSGYLPDPGLNVYGPTKAYERYLGEAMYGELSSTGISVSTLCPGPVKTGWSENAGRKDSIFSLDADYVAKEAFTGMQNGDLIIVPGIKFKALRIAANFVPTTVRIKLLRRFQNKLKG